MHIYIYMAWEMGMPLMGMTLICMAMAHGHGIHNTQEHGMTVMGMHACMKS